MPRRRGGATAAVLAVATFALASGARAEAREGPTLEVARLTLEEGVEAYWGYYTRDVRFVALSGRARAVPQLLWGKWRLRLDGDVRHRTPFASSDGRGLPQVQGEGEASLRFRASRRFRIAIQGTVGGRDRAAWPDQYQPTASGDLLFTDRYGGWWRGAGLRVGAMPLPHHHLRASYGYDLVEYRHDPSYDPIERPTHLVPRSHDEHAGEVAWHYLHDGLRLGGGSEWFYRQYFYAFSRDAGTGLTHAAAGGAPPNPLERLWGVDPSVDVEIDLADGRVTLDFEYVHHVAIDPYLGYRSVHGPYPKVRVEWRPRDGLELRLWLSYRRYVYFQGGYAQSANHPALDSGARRYDERTKGRLEVTRALGRQLELVFEAMVFVRTTNFPDYQPGVFPAARSYVVDWDFVNYRTSLGLRCSL